MDAVSLAVAPGEALALMGPSGSGKSTLLHLVGAVDRADAGRVLVDEVDLGRLSGRQAADYRRSVGFVFQRYNLLAALSVVDNVIAPVLPYRVPFDKRRRARALIGAVGLGGRESSLPSRLSGGQQQRVAIARALVKSRGWCWRTSRPVISTRRRAGRCCGCCWTFAARAARR